MRLYVVFCHSYVTVFCHERDHVFFFSFQSNSINFRDVLGDFLGDFSFRLAADIKKVGLELHILNSYAVQSQSDVEIMS